MSEPVEEPVQATEVVEVAEATDAPETAALVDAETTKPESTESAEQTGEADKPAEEEKQGDSKSNVLKTTARHDRDHRKNNRFDPSSLPASDDPALMRQQVEFYFNDANLPEDEHLWTLTGGPENKPVELKHLATFGRMRRFKDYAALVAALKESKTLDIAGEEGQEVVTRKTPYVLRGDKGDVMKRSVYVKGFGDEDPSTQFDLEAFFASLGDVNCVRLRRTDEKLFKGSVFVEFHSEEGAQAFLALDPKPKWKEHDLKIMSKRDYVDEKNRAIKAGEIQPSTNKERKFFEGRGGKADKARGGRGRGGGRFDKDDWKSRRDHDQRNGFRDGRGRGRGRGRGGRGGRGGRDGRDGRDGDRRRDDSDNRRNDRNGVQPSIQTTNDKGEPVSSKPADANEHGKRPREEEKGDAPEPQAKKVDTKADGEA